MCIGQAQVTSFSLSLKFRQLNLKHFVGQIDNLQDRETHIIDDILAKLTDVVEFFRL